MKINIWDNGGITCDRYTVFIDKHIFHMSIYPDRANEVNSYAGEFKPSIKAFNAAMHRMLFIKIDKIPKTLKYAIRQRILEIRHGE
jgi:hypothetical protein